MSLDICTECPTCGERSQGNNYTHNVIPMWEACGVYEALYESDGMNAGEVAEVIARGIQYFRTHFSEMTALNPPNGWGDAESAYEFLQRVHLDMSRHSNSVVGVSR